MYRVMQENGRYYPQRRGFFGWYTLYDVDILGRKYISYNNLDDAKQFLDNYTNTKVVKYHPYP